MGWNRKAKFGIHSGKTLRKWPTRKHSISPYGFYGDGKAKRCQFSVVKEMLDNALERSNSASNELTCHANFEIDDGIPFTNQAFLRRGYPENPVIHSLNKHKRWLLPELIKEWVERDYEAGIQDVSSRSPVEEGRRRDSDKLRVTVVERHVGSCPSRNQPDCVGVTTNYPDSPSGLVRTATKSHAHVGDLKSQLSGSEPELYYEFLSPFQEKSWPVNRQLVCRTKYDVDNVSGSKSRKKTKGRNKAYRNGHELDEPTDIKKFNFDVSTDNVDMDEENPSEEHRSAFLFPIGSYINAAIQSRSGTKMKNRTKMKNGYSHTNSHTQVSTPPTSIRFGKGDAIHVDDNDESMRLSPGIEDRLHQRVKDEQVDSEHLDEDSKADVHLLPLDIHPDNLKQEFSDDYIEGNVLPRKFIIKADLNKISPNVFTSSVDCCLLFEVSENVANNTAIDGQVAVSLPKTELLTENVVKSAESELKRLKLNGPLKVKTIVDVITEKIVQDSSCTCQAKRISYKKNQSSMVGKIPIEFIQGICQQKSEVCGFKKALRYSLDVGGKLVSNCLLIGGDKNAKTIDQSCCEICLLNVEDNDTTQDLIGFTRLLRCSHEFCNECWTHYIASCIRAGQGRISCPHFKCSTLIDEPIVWASTNCKLYQIYSKVSIEHAIASNPELRPCPAPDCSHLAHVPGSKNQPPASLPIFCHCGEIWCFACQNVAHWPASCEEAETFRKRCTDFEKFRSSSSHEGRITSVRVKRCPFCLYPIDKSTGCQHMLCRCGNDFCWDCLQPWTGHGWECKGPVEELEEVHLALTIGNARYNKYSKVAFSNFQARRWNFGVARKLAERAKRVENCHRLVSESDAVPCSRLVRSYIKSGVSRQVDALLHFKYLAHFVIQNTAAAMAVSTRKRKLGPLAKKIQMLEFIIGRIDEVLQEPLVLTDARNLANVQQLLKNGELLIKNMYWLTRANREH